MKKTRALFCVCALTGGFTLPALAETPFMTIRLWKHHHNDTNLLAQTLGALTRQKACCDEVWFCTESCKPPMSVHRASAVRMAAAAEKMRAIGIVPSLQVGSTIGHDDSGESSNYSGMAWGTMVGANGKATRYLSCPRQKGLLDYVREECTVYAAWKPESIWLDDDLRLTHHGGIDGCYCKTCLDLFGKQEKRAFTREELLQAMAKDAGLRRRWVAFGLESLAGVERAAAEGAHSVSPETRMGFQNIGRLESVNFSDWSPVFRTMAQASGHPAYSRCGNGYYSDAAPRGMIEKGYDIARLVARTPRDCVGRICPEIETYTHYAPRKTNHGLAVESVFFLSMGTDSLSYSIIASAREPMAWYEANWLHALAENRPFFEAYTRYNKGAALAGADPFFGRTFGAWQLPPSAQPDQWMREYYDSFVAPLAVLGVPFCPDSPAASCFVLDGQNARSICPDDFDRLYAKGIVADAYAMGELAMKGAPKLDTKEVLRFVPGTALPDGTIATYSGRLCETARGGRAVLLDKAFSDNVTSAERIGFLRLLDWASGGKLPVILETMAQDVVVPRVSADGSLRSVAVMNATIGEQEPVVLRLRGCPKGRTSIDWLALGEKPVSLPLTWEKDNALVTLPPIIAWNFGWLKLQE